MMDKLQSWSRELETGIQIVDEQHMGFFKQLNTFILRVKAGQISTAQAACEQMDYLNYYIMRHFNTEEAYMVKCDDAEYRAHQAEHKRLVFEVKALRVRLEKDGSEETVEELFGLLSQWVHQHILTWDVAFAHRYRAWEQAQTAI